MPLLISKPATLKIKMKKLSKFFFRIKSTFVFLAIYSVAPISYANEEEPSIERPQVSSFIALDRGNFASVEDIQISLTLTGNSNLISFARIYVAPATTHVGLDGLVANDNFFEFTELNNNSSRQLSRDLLDIQGHEVIEHVSYKLYLLLKYNDGSQSLINSEAITLSDEIVVTTLVTVPKILATEDIVLDRQGNLYINGGKTDKTSLYKVTADGSSSFATDEILSGGGGVAVARNGAIYNAFYSDSKIYRINSGVTEVFLSDERLEHPIGLSYDDERDVLYVGGFKSGKIFQISLDTKEVTELAGAPGNIGHLAYANDRFYVTDWRGNKVHVLNRKGQLLHTIGSGVSGFKDGNVKEASFDKPNGIAINPDQEILYITDKNGIRRVFL